MNLSAKANILWKRLRAQYVHDGRPPHTDWTLRCDDNDKAAFNELQTHGLVAVYRADSDELVLTEPGVRALLQESRDDSDAPETGTTINVHISGSNVGVVAVGNAASATGPTDASNAPLVVPPSPTRPLLASKGAPVAAPPVVAGAPRDGAVVTPLVNVCDAPTASADSRAGRVPQGSPIAVGHTGGPARTTAVWLVVLYGLFVGTVAIPWATSAPWVTSVIPFMLVCSAFLSLLLILFAIRLVREGTDRIGIAGPLGVAALTLFEVVLVSATLISSHTNKGTLWSNPLIEALQFHFHISGTTIILVSVIGRFLNALFNALLWLALLRHRTFIPQRLQSPAAVGFGGYVKTLFGLGALTWFDVFIRSRYSIAVWRRVDWFLMAWISLVLWLASNAANTVISALGMMGAIHVHHLERAVLALECGLFGVVVYGMWFRVATRSETKDE